VKKIVLLVLICAVLALPGLAQAGGTRVRAQAHGSFHGSFIVQGPFYWHPFFYPGPFAYGYPGGLNYAYPGPYISPGSRAPYSYGYPGPYSYGTLEYSSPNCLAKPDGHWLCS
jgi:hypothetical protein